MRGLKSLAGGIGLIAVLAGLPAQAQITVDQAAALERDLRGWIGGLVGPLADPAKLPIRLAPAGERYRLELGMMPFPWFSASADTPTTAFLRPLGDNRWALEEFRAPAAMTVESLPERKKLFAMTIGEQRLQAEIDTSFATPTRIEGQFGRIVQDTAGPLGVAVTKIRQFGFNTVWQPSGGGRLSQVSQSKMTGYETSRTAPGDGKFTFSATEMTSTSKGDGVSPEHLGATIRTLSALIGDVTAKPDGVKGEHPDSPTVGQRKMLHALLDNVAELFLRVETGQTWTGMKFSGADMNAQLDRFNLTSTMSAPGGKAEFGIRLELAGFQSAMIPAGPIRQLVPKRIAIAPRLTGAPKGTVVAFLSRAIDVAGKDDADLMDEATQLLSDNPLVVALDDLDIDLGTSRLRGSGQLKVAAADDITGAAELRMTGLDALIRSLRQVPEAAMATPILLMLKGLGEAAGAETVWRIVYAEQRVTVNGSDLSALLGGNR